MFRCFFLVAVSVQITLTSGCGPENPRGRIAVSGHITLDGKQLQTGFIEFAPQNAGVGSGSQINGGTYTIPETKGLPPGKYDVRIFSPQASTSADKISIDGAPGGGGRPGVERVAARFNSETTLAVEIPIGGGPQSVDFAVKSK